MPKIISSIQTNKIMQAIRNGFVVTMPLLLAGALGLLFVNFPLPSYQNFMFEFFGPTWKTAGIWLFNSTVGILSLVLSFSVSYNLIELHNETHSLRQVNPILGSMVAFTTVLLLMQPFDSTRSDLWQWSGVSGLFVSLLTACLSTSMMLAFSRIRKLRLRLSAEEADQIIPQTFEILIPSLLTLTIFVIIKLAIAEAISLVEAALPLQDNHVPIDNPHQLFYTLLKFSFSEVNSELGGALLYSFLSQVTWFFGIHGPNLLAPITHDVYNTASSQNIAAAAAGLALPNIVTKEFFDHFVYPGGSGTTLGLIISILLFSRDAANRKVAQLSSLPGLFNINETIIFGLPIIINPAFLVPFIATPLLLTLTTYAAMYFGLVPPPSAEASWTTPTLIGGYIVTGSWSGSILQITNLGLSILIYTPFVFISDRIKQKRFENLLGDLTRTATSNTLGPRGKKCIDRGGGVGVLARSLVSDLEQALNNDGELYLVYQPQIHYKEGRVGGTEALLRWRHPVYGEIPAPVTIAIAEDSMIIQALGLKVLDSACRQQAAWREKGVKDVKMSINLSTNQLADPELFSNVEKTLGKYNLPANAIELEVTESIAVDSDSSNLITLKELGKLGVDLAIDDFGMGHTSLTYIKHFPVNTLKIDGSLSRDVLNDALSQEVIITIVEFCNAMNISTVVEFVESADQLGLLWRLGCNIFQGYFFSPPLSGEACLNFILNYKQDYMDASI